MTNEPSSPRDRGRVDDAPPDSIMRTLIGRISRLEIVVGVAIAACSLLLVVIEPDVLEAPFENERTVLFTVGATALAALAFVAMLWRRVPPVIRVVALVVPFVIVNAWLISPYFLDDVVDEDFATSISEQLDDAATDTPPEVVVGDASLTPSSLPVENEPVVEEPPVTAELTEQEAAPLASSGPVLLGAGRFVGLAGHSGSGDAGIFRNSDGSLVLRFESFDIENGPDLEVYLVPGADQVSLPEGSIHLGELKGNIGDQNYDVPAGIGLTPGAYTVLVWCEAFSVEFVGATIIV